MTKKQFEEKLDKIAYSYGNLDLHVGWKQNLRSSDWIKTNLSLSFDQIIELTKLIKEYRENPEP